MSALNLNEIERLAASKPGGSLLVSNTIPALIAEVRRLTAERDAARAALARVQAQHCECTTVNCACGGGPGWCHGCDESWPCATARALAVPGPGEQGGEQ